MAGLPSYLKVWICHCFVRFHFKFLQLLPFLLVYAELKSTVLSNLDVVTRIGILYVHRDIK